MGVVVIFLFTFIATTWIGKNCSDSKKYFTDNIIWQTYSKIFHLTCEKNNLFYN